MQRRREHYECLFGGREVPVPHPADRVETQCPCGFVKLHGWCDHGHHMADVGGAVHPFELVPYHKRTVAWKREYGLLPEQQGPELEVLLESMRKPSMTDITKCTGVLDRVCFVKSHCVGEDVWKEMKLDSTQTTLLPLVVAGRPRGRPSSKKPRVSVYTAERKTKKHRPKIDNVGNLFYVEKRKCKQCGRYGHLYGTCQGGGYIASIVDSMQADVYAVRAAAAKKRKQAEEPDEEDDE